MSALQEEITQKTLALCVQTGKMTAQLLQQAMKKVLADMEKHKTNPQLHHGKQTIRQLMKHGAGVHPAVSAEGLEQPCQNVCKRNCIRTSLDDDL